MAHKPTRMSVTALTGMAALMVAASAVLAQEPAAEQPDAEALLREAHARTTAAVNADDYSLIIELCRKADAAGLPEKRIVYHKKLSAWAHNRRGRTYSDRAARAADRDDSDEADRFEARALKDYDAAIRFDPKLWRAYHNRGVSRAIARRYDEAVDDFTEAVQLEPRHVNAWFNRAEIHCELGNFEQAAADYREAIRLDPMDAQTHTGRGRALVGLNRPAEAVREFTAAVRLHPNEARYRTFRAEVYATNGQWKEAAEDFRRAIELDDRSARAYRGAAWLMATCPDEEFRDDRLAISAAKKAIELGDDEEFRGFDVLAAAYAAAGQFDDAVKTVELAVEHAPDERQEELAERAALYSNNRPYLQRRVPSIAGRTTTDR